MNKYKNLKEIDREYIKWSLVGLGVIILFLFLVIQDKNASLVKDNLENQTKIEDGSAEWLDQEISGDINLEEKLKESGENTNNETEKDKNTLSDSTQNTETLKAKFSTEMEKGNTAFMEGNYNLAISHYNQALAYENSDKVYVRLFTVYGAQGNWLKAKDAIDTAIVLNPSYTDYWTSKLFMADEKLSYSYDDLKKIYNEALSKVDSTTKVNLVTVFARISEGRNLYSEAISLWEYAKALYPQNSVMYDAEIVRLKR